MSVVPSRRRPETCPSWCALDHGRHPGEDDIVHVSGALMVRRTVLRLCMTHDPATDKQEGPYVLVGAEEFSLHEADALIDALTQLVDRGAEVSPRAGA
jgi:hypothetical protein